MHSDAAAAIGICRRRGLGRVRHLAVADLWVQDRLRTGHVELVKVAGQDIVADLLTKYLDRPLHGRHVQALGLCEEGGRASAVAQIGSNVVACCLSRFYDPEDACTDELAEDILPF